MSKRLSGKRIFYIVMTLLVALEIFLFSSLSSISLGENIGFNIASIYHFGVFFMFTFFLLLSIKGKKIKNRTIFTVLLISLIYAFSDEFHQLFVPGRFSSIIDVLIDFAGSVLSVLVLKIIERFNKL